MEKLMAIALVACAIAIATLIFQSITNNRILTPGILGLDALYIMFQLIVVMTLGGFSVVMMNPYLNFTLSAFLMILMSLSLYRWVFTRTASIYYMVLVGIIMGTFFTSINGMLQIMISPDVFTQIMDKLFANFSNVNESLLIMSGGIIALVVLVVMKKQYVLDVLSLGKNSSINLGLSYNKEVKLLLLLVFLLISVATALVGPITFLGFFAVNISKNYMKTHQHKYLLLASCIIAMSVLIIGQFMVEHIFKFGLPISVLISIIGGTYFIAMLLGENKK